MCQVNFREMLTPIQLILNHYPSCKWISNIPLRVFGCTIYVHIHSLLLDPKAQRCTFGGYGAGQKGYKCYSTSNKRYFISMDVTFMQHLAFFLREQENIAYVQPKLILTSANNLFFIMES